MKTPARNHAQWIKDEALKLGFLSCGISKAGFLEEEALRLENWLNSNKHGKMGYMERYWKLLFFLDLAYKFIHYYLG